MSSVRLDTEYLLRKAREATGLEDFGDPRFREGLEVLVQTLDRHLPDDDARQRERNQLLMWLGTRLKMLDAMRRHPEIAQQDIAGPMLVTGLPRTGTSALFNLLDSDPDARGLLLWEATFPDPLEGHEPGTPDPRYEAMVAYMDANRDPEMDKIHYAHPDLPEECIFLQAYSFDGALRGWEICLEPYATWFRNHSLEFMYGEQRQFMQLLQWQRPGKRWLLKAPSHLWDFDALLKAFPDARLVWGHRDPVAVIPSVCSLQQVVYEKAMGTMDAPQRHRFGRHIMNWYAESLERALAARERVPGGQIFDYAFSDFVADPKAVLDGLYRHFDLPMTAQTERALVDHIESNRQGKHGVHEYSLDYFGLDEASVRERFAFYRDHPLIQP